MWKSDEEEPIELEEDSVGSDFTNRQLELAADLLLREHAKEIDPETGKERGIGGHDPILFEDHLYQRRRREIQCASGTPDPEIVAGLYNRQHPQGRKVNSPEQRTKHGASYYR